MTDPVETGLSPEFSSSEAQDFWAGLISLIAERSIPSDQKINEKLSLTLQPLYASRMIGISPGGIFGVAVGGADSKWILFAKPIDSVADMAYQFPYSHPFVRRCITLKKVSADLRTLGFKEQWVRPPQNDLPGPTGSYARQPIGMLPRLHPIIKYDRGKGDDISITTGYDGLCVAAFELFRDYQN